MRKGTITTIFICLVWVFTVKNPVLAETILFKTGKFINGTIVEKTDAYIKVDIYGVKLTYYLDEIKTIFEKRADLVYLDALKDAIGLKFQDARKKLSATADLVVLRDLSLAAIKAVDDAENNLISQESAVYFLKGLLYCWENKVDEGIGNFLNAIAAEPEYELFYVYLGATYIGAGKFQDAIDTLQKALAINTDSPEANHFLGSLYVHLDRRPEGISYLEKSIPLYQAQGNTEKIKAVNELLDKIR
ncbi:MAG: tetratricopeptide repeat protein [Candidatus Omnitrophica bacterium]|nr:tetratricopeptide repeat protein [Candidatus Omnitrophota bacterium]